MRFVPPALTLRAFSAQKIFLVCDAEQVLLTCSASHTKKTSSGAYAPVRKQRASYGDGSPALSKSASTRWN
ncbi:hypothetical protein KSZ_49160 [Dictyobacter formicarum]|uniref:Uncharacterized protein n=1 Tax=Dictyobacter formicarum TaxID=2778368 RepID=A0ABQ3VM94_9CHLR|nr:hypothetical protein KSZ_49160 [Dictyobacter formicarum]